MSKEIDEFKTVNCSNCEQRSCFINRFCSIQWKSYLSKNKSTQFYRKNQTIIFQDSSVRGIHFIYSGDVQVFKKSPDSSQSRILRIAKSGDILGHRGYGENLKYPISASTLRDTYVCFLDTKNFYDTMKNNPDFSINLALFYADELRKADNKFFYFTSMTVKQRLALILLDLAKSHGTKKNDTTKIDLFLSRQILMNLTATTYESTVRAIREMITTKAISFSDHTVTILDMKKLTLHAQEA
ncbi:MAG: Crp/Fnr family transcriptional regulator [Deltaproteobacteria bacterium]|nr:Crp/Fnr family transcriptional regulator [Deltaproteobacteria bacterium]